MVFYKKSEIDTELYNLVHYVPQWSAEEHALDNKTTHDHDVGIAYHVGENSNGVDILSI